MVEGEREEKGGEPPAMSEKEKEKNITLVQIALDLAPISTVCVYTESVAEVRTGP